MIICNTSPIIILGKQNRLNLLKKCFGKVTIPNTVCIEITQKKDCTESLALIKAISDNWIKVKKVSIIHSLETKNLGQGEKEAISLALQHKAILTVDDYSAKTYASIFGIEAHGTLHVIFLSYLRKIITKEEAVKILDRMILDGFYISTEVYSKFLGLLSGL